MNCPDYAQPMRTATVLTGHNQMMHGRWRPHHSQRAAYALTLRSLCQG